MERLVAGAAHGANASAAAFFQKFHQASENAGFADSSSPALTDRVLRNVEWNRVRLVVEYGPGVGSFTTEILRRMRSEAVLIAIETNGDFIDYLRGTVDDPGCIWRTARQRKWGRYLSGCSAVPPTASSPAFRSARYRSTHARKSCMGRTQRCVLAEGF